MLAYAVFAAGIAIGAVAARSRIVDGRTKAIAVAVAAAVTVQAGLGVATLMAAVPVWLGALHQLGGAGLLALATVLAWTVRRA
jgi:heme a synthase